MQASYRKEVENYRVLKRKNFKFYPHFHRQMEMLYLESGRKEVVIDGEVFQIEAGDVCISFPNQMHEYRFLEESRCYLLLMSIEDLDEYRQELTECLPANPIVKKTELPEYFPALWHELYDNYVETEDIRRSKAIGRMLFSIVFSGLEMKSGRSLTNMSGIQDVLEYIAKHYTEEISIEQVAKMTGFSVSSLSRIFSKKMHTTFTAYVNMLRVLKAQKRLRKTDKGIDEIAAECGFKSRRTFFRIFRANCGCTPGEYRKQLELPGNGVTKTSK